MIPKIIHHVWPGSDSFKEKFHAYRRSWMSNHPDWTFCFWRLDNLPSEFSPHIKNIVLQSEVNVVPKSDLIRFEILRIFGGLYVDTDMECLRPMHDFINLDFFAGYEDDQRTACPSLIGSVPNHPILCQVIDTSLSNFKQSTLYNINRHPNNVTGVAPFSNTIKNFKQDPKIKIFNKEYFYPVSWKDKHLLNQTHSEAFTKHHWSGLDPDGWVNKNSY